MVGHKLGEFALTRTFKGHPGDKKARRNKEHDDGNQSSRSRRVPSLVDKGRLVADLIRGKKVDQALNILSSPRRRLLASSRRLWSPRSPTPSTTTALTSTN